VYQRLTTPALFVAIFALIIALNVLCLGRYPAIGGDEVIIGSNALNLARHGSSARPIHHGSGFPLVDCFPPVAPILVAASYDALGFGVIQTKLPGLVLGIVTAVLLFVITVRIAGRAPATVATLVFILDPVTFNTWQSGRDDAYFVFAVAASVLAGYLAIDTSIVRSSALWFLAGILTAIAGAAYYPFAAPALLISILGLWAIVWQEHGLLRRDKLGASMSFVAGLAVVAIAISAWLSVNGAYCRAQILGMAPDYLSLGTAMRAIVGESHRYWEYATHDAGLANLMLGLVSVAMIPWVARRRWELALAFAAMLGFAAFLAIYVEKDSRYLATMVLLGCVGLAIVIREIDSGCLRWVDRWLVKPLVSLSIAVGLVRSAVIAFTLLYQWQGRDYPAFDAKVRSLVPHDARVIGPQTVWYALADSDTDLWLYTQGGQRFADVTGEIAMNDSHELANISHVIIDERQTADRLQGLRDYVHTNFKLVARVSPTFLPLPWAKAAPLDVDVYERDR
jgi:4-amino-4-deoxy-L-arabinose transferase-like glycosyltransferase